MGRTRGEEKYPNNESLWKDHIWKKKNTDFEIRKPRPCTSECTWMWIVRKNLGWCAKYWQIHDLDLNVFYIRSKFTNLKNHNTHTFTCTMGISGSEKRINKEGWNSKLSRKWSILGQFFGQKSLKYWKNDIWSCINQYLKILEILNFLRFFPILACFGPF